MSVNGGQLEGALSSFKHLPIAESIKDKKKHAMDGCACFPDNRIEPRRSFRDTHKDFTD